MLLGTTVIRRDAMDAPSNSTTRSYFPATVPERTMSEVADLIAPSVGTCGALSGDEARLATGWSIDGVIKLASLKVSRVESADATGGFSFFV